MKRRAGEGRETGWERRETKRLTSTTEEKGKETGSNWEER